MNLPYVRRTTWTVRATVHGFNCIIGKYATMELANSALATFKRTTKYASLRVGGPGL